MGRRNTAGAVVGRRENKGDERRHRGRRQTKPGRNTALPGEAGRTQPAGAGLGAGLAPGLGAAGAGAGTEAGAGAPVAYLAS